MISSSLIKELKEVSARDILCSRGTPTIEGCVSTSLSLAYKHEKKIKDLQRKIDLGLHTLSPASFANFYGHRKGFRNYRTDRSTRNNIKPISFNYRKSVNCKYLNTEGWINELNEVVPNNFKSSNNLNEIRNYGSEYSKLKPIHSNIKDILLDTNNDKIQKNGSFQTENSNELEDSFGEYITNELKKLNDSIINDYLFDSDSVDIFNFINNFYCDFLFVGKEYINSLKRFWNELKTFKVFNLIKIGEIKRFYTNKKQTSAVYKFKDLLNYIFIHYWLPTASLCNGKSLATNQNYRRLKPLALLRSQKWKRIKSLMNSRILLKSMKLIQGTPRRLSMEVEYLATL